MKVAQYDPHPSSFLQLPPASARFLRVIISEMKRRRLLRTLFLLTLASALCGCAAAPPPAGVGQPAARTTPAAQAAPAEAAASPAAPASSSPAAPDAQPASPTAADVRAALERTYRGAVAFDERAVASSAAVGDFNGDGSEDLMVEARPAPGRVAELNDELANWIVTEPLTVRPPDPRQFDPHQGVQKLAPREGRPRVEQADALLVVVHGYKEAGWRNPEALQTFLLKNVAGTELRPEGRLAAQAGMRTGIPRLLGDVLHENLGGARGLLYWTGAGYGWFGTRNAER
jgi:hypothetical protein